MFPPQGEEGLSVCSCEWDKNKKPVTANAAA
jgi:hypothetical protein